MKIYIETIMGSRWTIQGVSPASQVKFLKNVIRSKCGVPAAKQMLTFNTALLQDDGTLSQHNIAPGSTIRLTLAATTGL